MNVALFVEAPLPPVSRANLRLYKLGLALVKKGYGVHMVGPSFYPHRRRNMVYSGIFVHQYPGLAAFLYSRVRLFVRSLHLFLSVVYALLLHKSVGIGVVHGWNPLAGLAAVFSGRLIGCPVFIDFTDFYSDIARTDSPMMAPLFRMIERFILLSAERVVVVSDVMREALGRYYGVPRSKIHVIPDGTDAEMFNPGVSGARIRSMYGLGDHPVLIYHGDIKPPDGVDVLLNAFAVVLEKMPDARLVILGGGGAYFEGLKRLAEDLGLEPSVIFVGWVPHRVVPEYVAAADVGVMPLRSTLNHNCYVSFKLFEYWGVGKPVVVSRVEAISEIVEDGVNGVLVQPENEVGLAEGVLSILNDRERARSVGENGRKLVEERYNWESLMEREAEIYREAEV
ncbi:MAG: glycosyltransferase family 4 protein [Candidatus Geothermarchaeales archaeon]